MDQEDVLSVSSECQNSRCWPGLRSLSLRRYCRRPAPSLPVPSDDATKNKRVIFWIVIGLIVYFAATAVEMYGLSENAIVFFNKQVHWHTLQYKNTVVLVDEGKFTVEDGYLLLQEPLTCKGITTNDSPRLKLNTQKSWEPTLLFRMIIGFLLCGRWLFFALRYVLLLSRSWDHVSCKKEVIGIPFAVLSATILHSSLMSVDLRFQRPGCISWWTYTYLRRASSWSLEAYAYQHLMWIINISAVVVMGFGLGLVRMRCWRGDRRLGRWIPDSTDPILKIATVFFFFSAFISMAILVSSHISKPWNAAVFISVLLLLVESFLQYALGLYEMRPSRDRARRLEQEPQGEVAANLHDCAAEAAMRKTLLSWELLQHLQFPMNSDAPEETKNTSRRLRVKKWASRKFRSSKSNSLSGAVVFWQVPGTVLFVAHDDPKLARPVMKPPLQAEGALEAASIDEATEKLSTTEEEAERTKETVIAQSGETGSAEGEGATSVLPPCLACLDRSPCILFLPCHHVPLCSRCCEQLMVTVREKAERERHTWLMSLSQWRNDAVRRLTVRRTRAGSVEPIRRSDVSSVPEPSSAQSSSSSQGLQAAADTDRPSASRALHRTTLPRLPPDWALFHCPFCRQVASELWLVTTLHVRLDHGVLPVLGLEAVKIWHTDYAIIQSIIAGQDLAQQMDPQTNDDSYVPVVPSPEEP